MSLLSFEHLVRLYKKSKLFALYFYLLIVKLAFALIDYHNQLGKYKAVENQTEYGFPIVHDRVSKNCYILMHLG